VCTSPSLEGRQVAGAALAWAFPARYVAAPGHTIFVPRRCVATIGELLPAEREAIGSLAKPIVLALKAAYGAQGFHQAWIEGAHVQMHLIPRTTGERGDMHFDPCRLSPDGGLPILDQRQLLDVRDRIKRHLPPIGSP
jgi:diadenosine tetraphosphate (Ap4A) HIT family hydrolase